MLTGQAPSSQKADVRPITFVLVDNTQPGARLSSDRTITLYPRPEELTRASPSRVNVQQTLGATPWADDFGEGIGNIQISGHTGWRPPPNPSTGTDDGAARYVALKTTIFDQWHTLRLQAVQSGVNPEDAVQLQFADSLNQFASTVVPMSFVLRRNRSRPLLYQYQISLMEIGPVNPSSSQSAQQPTQAQQQATAVASLQTSANEVSAAAANPATFVDISIAAPIQGFLTQAAGVFNAVVSAESTVAGVTNSMLSLATLTAQSGMNMFRTLTALPTVLTDEVMNTLMGIASSFSNAFCVLTRIIGQGPVFQDYSPLEGSSNCSSTNGGAPPSIFYGLNPFQYTNPTQIADPATASSVAQQSMLTLANTDPVMDPLNQMQIGAAASAIAGGIVIS
jgi:hypothetical protein